MALESRDHHSTQNQKLHRTVSLDFFKNRPSPGVHPLFSFYHSNLVLVSRKQKNIAEWNKTLEKHRRSFSHLISVIDERC